MVGSILFGAGLAGLIIVSGVFAWEAKVGLRYGDGVRARLDTIVRCAYRTLVFGEIPRTPRKKLVRSIRHAAHYSVNVLIIILRSIERPLSRMSRRMRYTPRDTAASGTPSPFLKEIGEGEYRNGKVGRDSV